ncbi:cytochrome b/b6 domain-containing protein [Paracoccus albus]|uniref:cytochrome b/b6 domain-containing protein n=1 Tax=Paracoccus albus TaxID=3017784 RepID=UPI0022F05966|nr:cytochrome b/b6 domain-containing protein [Paracoccus albus]WBU60759.1 cytochrome b/b6 domain-containing protein [Paracoccus albus]
MADRPEVRQVKLWDPLLRGFHWLLAFFVTGAWLLGNYGPTSMKWHFWFGYAVTFLLAFRLIWGFIGPAPARFSHFLRGPKAVGDYVRHMFLREPSYWPGHNPLGALSVIAMLAALVAQVLTGMMSESENFVDVGPLAGYVSSSTSDAAKDYHEFGANLILILVLLHVVVIVFYRFWKKEDLVGPMVHGNKDVRGK